MNHGIITTIVCKRTVKAKKAKPEVEVVQLDEDSVQVCTVNSINKTVCKYSISLYSVRRTMYACTMYGVHKDLTTYIIKAISLSFNNNNNKAILDI